MMFNSTLASSISGWFNSAFQPNNDDNESAKVEQETENHKKKDENNVPEEDSLNNMPEDGDEQKSTNTDVVNGKEESSSSILDLDTDHVQKKLSEETQKMMESAKSLGSYLFGMASEATKKVSDTVSTTATSLKKTVEEKTILGDLNKEQEDFIRKKREKEGCGAVPPWEGYQEEATMKQQILALSTDSRNFLRSPPSGVQFQFDFEQMFPVAMATLKEDENLTKMRFRLVPIKVKEETFWRNYFYRVSLIKQSAQLSTLTEMQKNVSDTTSSDGSSIVIIGSTATGTISRSSSSKSLPKNETSVSQITSNQSAGSVETPDLNDVHDENPNSEFVSDAFDPSTLNPDELEREMRELGMDGEEDIGGDIPKWEHELQKELQDYEIVQDQEKDEVWEREIDNMLSES